MTDSLLLAGPSIVNCKICLFCLFMYSFVNMLLGRSWGNKLFFVFNNICYLYEDGIMKNKTKHTT